MEREIKFRAWNSIHNRIEQVSVLSLYDNKAKHLWQAEDGHQRYDDFEIMQFTGLLDKNGKEIYEGDVLARPNYLNSEVWFDDGTYLIGLRDKSDDMLTQLAATKYQVIGNIYENPELISNQ